ncbi:MAG: hypoxanthine phosphoribosyltransferase [Clostridiaceae bacterium]|nr:hypoxanthine phosphoribosyltransferase [Clostridiaceae bacterium]
MQYNDDIERVLIDKETILKRVKGLGAEITRTYEGKELLVVGVLKGGFIFMADLVREIRCKLQLDFISVSSYGNSTESSGIVRIIKDIETNIANKHVMLVEELIDTGLTLSHLKQLLYTRKPASIKICTMFDKPSRRKINLEVDFIGLEVPDYFIVGYGLDYSESYRNLPEVCVLKPEVYRKKCEQ